MILVDQFILLVYKNLINEELIYEFIYNNFTKIIVVIFLIVYGHILVNLVKDILVVYLIKKKILSLILYVSEKIKIVY